MSDLCETERDRESDSLAACGLWPWLWPASTYLNILLPHGGKHSHDDGGDDEEEDGDEDDFGDGDASANITSQTIPVIRQTNMVISLINPGDKLILSSAHYLTYELLEFFST